MATLPFWLLRGLPQWPRQPQWGRVPLSRPRPAPVAPRPRRAAPGPWGPLTVGNTAFLASQVFATVWRSALAETRDPRPRAGWRSLIRRRIRARVQRGRLLRRGLVRYPCKHSPTSQRRIWRGDGKRCSGRKQHPLTATHRSRRRDHSPMPPRSGVLIPAPDIPRARGRAGRYSFEGLVDFGDYYY